MMATYQNSIQYYTDLGDKVHADFYRLKRYELQDSISKASHINDINTVLFLHEIDKMNDEVKELTYKEQTKQRILWIVGTFALIAVLLLVLLYISRRRIRRDINGSTDRMWNCSPQTRQGDRLRPRNQKP